MSEVPLQSSRLRVVVAERLRDVLRDIESERVERESRFTERLRGQRIFGIPQHPARGFRKPSTS